METVMLNRIVLLVSCLGLSTPLFAAEAKPVPPAETSAPKPAPLIDTAPADPKKDAATGKAPVAAKKPDDNEEVVEITVTATRTKESVRDIPQAVSVVTQKDIQRRQATTPATMLEETPGVFVNHVAAQGSPIIR